MSIRYHIGLATLCFALVGCGARSDSGPDALAGAKGTAGADPEWTAGIVDQSQAGASAAMLVAVRTAAQDGFDRIVFEFDSQVPGYRTEYVDQPVRQCGSGKATQVAGQGWLKVRFYPANAHTPEGAPTVAERELRPGLPLLQELELTCDFEAVVTWALGVVSPNRYRVRELSGPPRLVVDVRY